MCVFGHAEVVAVADDYHVASAGYLLGLGRRVNTATPEGYTVLHFAARNGALEPVRWLVELNADLAMRATKLAGDFKVVGTAAEVARTHGLTRWLSFWRNSCVMLAMRRLPMLRTQRDSGLIYELRIYPVIFGRWRFCSYVRRY